MHNNKIGLKKATSPRALTHIRQRYEHFLTEKHLLHCALHCKYGTWSKTSFDTTTRKTVLTQLKILQVDIIVVLFFELLW